MRDDSVTKVGLTFGLTREEKLIVQGQKRERISLSARLLMIGQFLFMFRKWKEPPRCDDVVASRAAETDTVP